MPKSINSVSKPSLPASSDDGSFHTENLELAAYLMARGHRLVGATPQGRLVVFEFPANAAADVANFFSGAISLTPITLFEQHRTLRSLIATVRNSQGRTAGGVA